jgi:hypothetical protein
METLAVAVEAFEGTAFVPYLDDIWQNIKNYMVNGKNETDELEALKCIREIAKAMSVAAGSSRNGHPLEQFITLITNTCLENFADPELKYVTQCGKLLMAAASSSSLACDIIIKMEFNNLIGIYKKQETLPKKKIILNLIVDILTACRLVGSKKILPFKDELLNILTISVLDVTYSPLRETAISGLQYFYLRYF